SISPRHWMAGVSANYQVGQAVAIHVSCACNAGAAVVIRALTVDDEAADAGGDGGKIYVRHTFLALMLDERASILGIGHGGPLLLHGEASPPPPSRRGKP